MKQSLIKIIRHSIIIGLLFFLVAKISALTGIKYPLALLITDFLLDVSLFYFFRYCILPFLVFQQQWGLWLTAIPFGSICCFILYYVIHSLYTLISRHIPFTHPSILLFEFSLFPFSITSVIASLSFYIHWSKKKDIELMRSELLRQRALVNPHFTLNVLNSFYLPTLETNPALAEKMVVFGEVLRFTLEKEDESGLITLQDELDNLQHHIELYQFINRKNKLFIDVRLDIEAYAEAIKVPPMISVTFVENMFKHGDLSNEKHPGRIAINCNKKLLSIRVSNIKANSKKAGTQIGIDNIKFRLKHAYGKNFKLDIKDGEKIFLIDLTIKL